MILISVVLSIIGVSLLVHLLRFAKTWSSQQSKTKTKTYGK